MRIHPAALLVLIAFAVPVIVELRTMLVWVDVELSVAQTVAVGAVVIGAIVVWAVLPPRNGAESGASG